MEDRLIEEEVEDLIIIMAAEDSTETTINTSTNIKATAGMWKVGELKKPPHKRKDLLKEMKKVKLSRQDTIRIKISTTIRDIMTNCRQLISAWMLIKISTKQVTFQT